MPRPADDERIPEAVPPLPLPALEYDDLEKEDRIGTGGDADVYRATVEHDGYTYPVAVKEPRFEGTIQRRVVEKFQTEAETWSRLTDHDNIVSVYGWGTDPLPWLALEYMDGGTLDAHIGSLEVVEALWLAGRIAEGIRHGHRHGVAHLDIKPTNVLLRDTPDGKWAYPKVSDWGLAKLLLEHSNSIEGISPTYAAPEQFDAETYGDADDFTDIYQLGAVVYALVAGDPPFTGPSTAVMQGVLQEEPAPPSAVNPDVPAAVDEVVLKALAKEKDDRYEGIVPFRQELDRLFEEYSTGDGTGTGSLGGSPTADSTAQMAGREDPAESQQGRTSDTEDGSQASSTEGRDTSTASPQEDRDDDGSVVSRRAALGMLGVGVIGGGGWMATQMGGSDDNESASGAVPTQTPTETVRETSTARSVPTETMTATASETPTATAEPMATETPTEEPDTTPPSISELKITNPSDQQLVVSFDSDKQLASIQVEISGPETTTLTLDDFSETIDGNIYTYEATYKADSGGDYTATLSEAIGIDGYDGAGGKSVSASIETVDGSIATDGFENGSVGEWEMFGEEYGSLSAERDSSMKGSWVASLQSYGGGSTNGFQAYRDFSGTLSPGMRLETWLSFTHKDSHMPEIFYKTSNQGSGSGGLLKEKSEFHIRFDPPVNNVWLQIDGENDDIDDNRDEFANEGSTNTVYRVTFTLRDNSIRCGLADREGSQIASTTVDHPPDFTYNTIDRVLIASQEETPIDVHFDQVSYPK